MTCETCGGEAKEIARHDIVEPPMIEIKFECENCHGHASIFYVWEAINENA